MLRKFGNPAYDDFEIFYRYFWKYVLKGDDTFQYFYVFSTKVFKYFLSNVQKYSQNNHAKSIDEFKL